MLANEDRTSSNISRVLPNRKEWILNDADDKLSSFWEKTVGLPSDINHL